MKTDTRPTLQPGAAPLTKASLRRGLIEGCTDANADALAQMVDPDTLLAIVYPPLLASEAAVEYAGRVADLCAARRIGAFKKPCRELRRIAASYRRRMLADLRTEVHDTLERHFRAFTALGGTDVQTLWFTVNQELKTRYPHLADYELPTEVLVAESLARYALSCDARSSRALSDFTGRALGGVNPLASALLRVLPDMHRELRIDGATMVERAMRVIDNKMQSLNFLIYEEEPLPNPAAPPRPSLGRS